MPTLSPSSMPLLRWCCCLLLSGLLSACNNDDNDADAAASNKVVSSVRQSDGSAASGPVYQVGDHVLLQAPASSDAGASYQWYRNGELIEGATGASYELGQSSSLDDQASFSVRVSSAANPAGTLSQPLLLSVKAGEGVDLLAGFLGGDGYADGVGSMARFGLAASLARDAAGNLYVAEGDTQVIRKISPDGVVSTLAGLAKPDNNTQYEAVDGTGAAARFRFLREITMGRDGNLYALDVAVIRRITPAGVVTTLAGNNNDWGVVDGAGAVARFANPQDMTTDAAGNLLLRDGVLIRKITPAGVVSTVARLADDPPSGGLGPIVTFGARNRLKQPADGISTIWPIRTPKWQAGLVADAQGNIYSVETNGDRLLKIAPDGTVSEETQLGERLATLLGTADFWLSNAVNDAGGNLFLLLSLPYSGDRFIVRLAADGGLSRMYSQQPGQGDEIDPISDIVAHAGQVYATFTQSNTLRRIDADGKVTRLAGSGEVFAGARDGLGRTARFSSPTALVADSLGNSYVAGYDHTIRKISPNGMVSTLAGKAGEAGNQDGSGSNARFNYPQALAIGKDGNLYVADGGNKVVRVVTPAGVVTTLTSTGASLQYPYGLAFDNSGTLYVEDSQQIVAIGADGSVRSYPFTVALSWHSGLTGGASGNLYAVSGYSIVKLSTDGTMTTIAGDMGQPGYADGVGSAARFQKIGGMTADAAGNLYVADTFNQTIRKVTPAGVVSTVVGQAGVRGVQLGAAGRLHQPVGVTVGTRHGRPALFILNRAHQGDWQQGVGLAYPWIEPSPAGQYWQSDVNVVSVPLP